MLNVSETFRVTDLGTLEYLKAWDVQHEVHAGVARRELPPTLLLVEHPAVLTLGRKAKEGENIIVSRDFLSEQGIAVHAIERGGDVTYHGPGQLVGYPIFPVGRRVRDFLRLLEEALVRTLSRYGLEATGSPGYAGVWVGDEKVAAIGVAIQKHVAFHGFALNVSTNLEHFSYIVPCGIQDRGVTSLQKLLGREINLQEVKAFVEEDFRQTFQDYDFSIPEL